MSDEKTAAAGPAVPGDELLRIILESTTDFAIFAQDLEGVVISWNAGAERLTGYPAADIMGRSGDLVFTPEDRAADAPAGERRKALADGRALNERWHMRRDGSRFWGSGLLMPLKTGTGFVKVMRDLTERHQMQEQVRESERRFRLLATHIPQLVFRTDSDGMRTWGSPQWADFTGLSDLASRGPGWLEAIHPDDREATMAAWDEAQRTGDYYIEHRTRRVADGSWRWHQTRAAPLDEDDPAGSEWVGTSADIHELRGLKDRQGVLLAELQHRTRNLLSVVQALARQTLRSSKTVREFAVEFENRLSALSRVQGLLARSDYRSVDLGSIVTAELAAHGADGGAKAVVEGPPVQLPPTSAQALALALHELATNAVKYGALGQPEGRLRVKWWIEDAAARHVQLDWQESGVRMPEGGVPGRYGFGRELIERALPYQLDARTRLEFGEDGVRCSIAAPIAPEQEATSG